MKSKPAVHANQKAVRIQQSVAFAVVVLPLIGVVTALYLVWNNGVTTTEIGILIGSYIFGMLGITLGFHRFFAHRSFKASRGLTVALAILGSMSAEGPLLFWVATHRRHHVYSDQPGDPHSPQFGGDGFWGGIKGFWHGHIGWMFTGEQTDWVKFVPDLIKDKLLFRIHRLYLVWLLIGLAVPALLGGVLMGTWYGVFLGFLWGGLVRIFLVNQALWCVGSISHMYGSRPFRHITKDCSANNYFVAVVAFGEGNQNNHHAFPGSARHGLEWWQPDFTSNVIFFLRFLGLLWDVKTPTKNAICAARALSANGAMKGDSNNDGEKELA